MINVVDADCPMLLLMDRIANRWAVRVMGSLWEAPLRFNQLRRTVGVSQKVLSQCLKSLQRDGLVARKVTPTVPISVEYSLTPLGVTLAEAVQPLRAWSEHYVDEVLAARVDFDGTVGVVQSQIAA